MPSSTKKAAGNIIPARFVKMGATDGACLQAGATDVPIGVSGAGTRNTPYSTLDDGFHAISGENTLIYGENEKCMLECGAAVTVGAFLKPSTNGVAIPVASNNDVYGARAEMAGSSGQLIEATVMIGYFGA